MKLTVNGKEHTHEGSDTIEGLIEELGAVKAHTALMLNGQVVPSEEWAATPLKENDTIEMLVFVGGG